MKKILFLSKVIFSIALPIALLLSTLSYVSSDLDFYRDRFKEESVSENTGLTEEELLFTSGEIVKYLQGNRDDFDIALEDGTVLFGEREKLHMEDVRVLFDRGFMIRNVAFALAFLSFLFIMRFDRASLGKSFIAAFLVPVVLISALGIVMLVDFERAFTVFHHILFDNDLWLLDPRTDVLIVMLPLNFFYKMAYRIVFLFLAEIAVLLGIGLVFNRITKSN